MLASLHIPKSPLRPTLERRRSTKAHIRTLTNGTNLATSSNARERGKENVPCPDEMPDWSSFLTLAALSEIVVQPGQAPGARLENPDVVTRALAIRQVMIQPLPPTERLPWR